ncbi:MAG: hypothetical protein M3Z30_07800 [Gemmatimonadota bacterium]|nr:hypothetical protein [Gemmatimonadota bacterium]
MSFLYGEWMADYAAWIYASDETRTATTIAQAPQACPRTLRALLPTNNATAMAQDRIEIFRAAVYSATTAT